MYMIMTKIVSVLCPLFPDSIMTTFQEEQKYQEIFTMLLMSGEYREQDIDAQVMEIMDHPQYYPEYF